MIQFQTIPAGAMQLGLSDDDVAAWSDAHPQFSFVGEVRRPQVSLASFQLQVSPVTNQEFAAFVDAKGYATTQHWKRLLKDDESLERVRTFVDTTGKPGPLTWVDGKPPGGQEMHPVSGVSHYEALAFASFAKARLPTDGEWEYAARNGAAQTCFPWGDVFDADACVHASEAPQAVNSLPAGNNTWGVTDLCGNIAEWVADGTDDTDEDPGLRYVRGDFYAASSPVSLRSTVRTPHPPSSRWRGLGFRLARSLVVRQPIRIGGPKRRVNPPKEPK